MDSLSSCSFQYLVLKLGWTPEVSWFYGHFLGTQNCTHLLTISGDKRRNIRFIFDNSRGVEPTFYISTPQLRLEFSDKTAPVQGRVHLIDSYLLSQSWLPILKAKLIWYLSVGFPPFRLFRGREYSFLPKNSVLFGCEFFWEWPIRVNMV